MNRLSIVIPARNEPYLKQTIEDLLTKARGDIEIIAILDGYWPDAEDIVENPKVKYIHFSPARGMRNAINAGVSISTGNFIMKTDAHCMFSEGYDVELIRNSAPDWVVVPRRFPLIPEKWEIEARIDDKYPIDYMYLDKELHGREWREKNTDPKLKERIVDELMSFQGSCWFMPKSYYEKLELMDEESYGEFYAEAQEIGLKAWLSGGRVMVNKNVWYAHWHKTEGRGYSLNKKQSEIGEKFVKNWRIKGMAWKNQKFDLEWLYNRFGSAL